MNCQTLLTLPNGIKSFRFPNGGSAGPWRLFKKLMFAVVSTESRESDQLRRRSRRNPLFPFKLWFSKFWSDWMDQDGNRQLTSFLNHKNLQNPGFIYVASCNMICFLDLCLCRTSDRTTARWFWCNILYISKIFLLSLQYKTLWHVQRDTSLISSLRWGLYAPLLWFKFYVLWQQMGKTIVPVSLFCIKKECFSEWWRGGRRRSVKGMQRSLRKRCRLAGQQDDFADVTVSLLAESTQTSCCFNQQASHKCSYEFVLQSSNRFHIFHIVMGVTGRLIYSSEAN